MKLNPILRSLGYDARDRVVVTHADDIGMCAATVNCLEELFGFGLVTSASAMIPCDSFAEVARFCRAHARVDMGVHLTLTSEFETHRWRPVTDADRATGLTDDYGYFHRTTSDLAEHAAPDAARDEMRAQVERALQAGVDVTHLDTHMFTAFMPQFLPHYVELGREFQLPALLLRFDDPACGLSARAHDSQPEAWARAAQIVRDAEAQGAPVFDRLAKMPLDRPEDRLTQAKMIFDAAPAGLTHFLIHPATDAPELRAVTRDWPSRVADYETFTSAELRRHVKDSGVQLVGYRALRDALRRSNRETTVSLRGTDAWTSKSSAAMN